MRGPFFAALSRTRPAASVAFAPVVVFTMVSRIGFIVKVVLIAQRVIEELRIGKVDAQLTAREIGQSFAAQLKARLVRELRIVKESERCVFAAFPVDF